MTEDEKAIRRLVADWFEATKRGDLDAVLALMTDDVVFLVPGKPPMMGKPAFAAASRAQAAHGQPSFDGESTIQEISVHGEWAWMWSRLAVSITPPGGQAVVRSGHTLTILRKEGGRWLLARDANLLAST